MPPKTRKSVTLWQSCELCNSIFSSKDVAAHADDCQSPRESWSCGFIRDKLLYGFLDDIKPGDVNFKLQQDNLVLMSQSAMQLCEFSIGSPVLVNIAGQKIIKNVWPTGEGTLTSVKLSKSGYDFLFDDGFKSKLVTISGFKNQPLPAGEVHFKVLNEQTLSINIETLISFISSFCRGKIIFIGCKVKIPFYGKNLIIEVTKCKKIELSNELEDSISNLCIDQQYFLSVEKTSWISTEIEPEPKHESVISLNKIGGYKDIIRELKENIETTLNSSKKIGGLQSCYGILIYGPHGVGKTVITQAVANESKANVIHIQSSEIFTKYYGEAESRLRSAFKSAVDKTPCILILDNVETLCPCKGTDQERRVAATLLSVFDSLQSKRIVVLATTSRPDDIDSGLRRPGRIEREIEISVPSPEDRISILQKFSDDPKLNETFEAVGKASHGFVGADLAAVWYKACMKAAVANQDSVRPENVLSAFSQVQPSAMREVYVQVPNVKWSDIGGQEELKLKLQQAVEWPIRHPESFKRLGITPPRGVLMYGPPGCSKTMIAKALATESELNFLSVKGSDIFSKWVGESERAVRNLFRKARSVAPAIIFIDEVDALGGEREMGTSSSGGSAVRERVLSQFLTEIDGVQSLDNVVIIAATNRPDRIDKALLRPGRLDRLIYVPLPDVSTRKQILELQLRKTPVAEGFGIDLIAKGTEGYSGAEVVAVCKEAALKALEENIDAVCVTMDHFLAALKIITPRTPKNLLQLYDDYKDKYKITEREND